MLGWSFRSISCAHRSHQPVLVHRSCGCQCALSGGPGRDKLCLVPSAPASKPARGPAWGPAFLQRPGQSPGVPLSPGPGGIWGQGSLRAHTLHTLHTPTPTPPIFPPTCTRSHTCIADWFSTPGTPGSSVPRISPPGVASALCPLAPAGCRDCLPRADSPEARGWTQLRGAHSRRRAVGPGVEHPTPA